MQRWLLVAASRRASAAAEVNLTPPNTMPRITLRVPDALLDALQTRAENEHRPTANMALRILSLELGVAASEELDEAQNPKLEGIA